MADPAELRRSMVERQLRARGIGDAHVLAAMSEVPREAFVAEGLRAFAYDDGPLPIGEEQDDLAAVHRRPDDPGCRHHAR